MGIGAAIAASAGTALIGANITSNAQKTAANEQAQSSANALAQQQSMFGTAQNALNPFVNAGQSAIPQLQALLTPGSKQAGAITSNPGLQFQSKYGDLAATNQLAAQGLGGSGGPLGTALSGYNQGLASTYYQNAVNNLQGLVNTGVGAGQGLASGAINSGNAQAGTLQNIGTAQASGTLGSANALAGGITGAGTSAGNSLLLSQILGQGNGGANFYNGQYTNPNNDQLQDAAQDAGI